MKHGQTLVASKICFESKLKQKGELDDKGRWLEWQGEIIFEISMLCWNCKYVNKQASIVIWPSEEQQFGELRCVK